MKAALAALTLALSATVAIAQAPEQLTPEQQKLRDYMKPGGQFEKDNPGIRERAHEADINRRVIQEMRSGRGPRMQFREGRCPRSDPHYPNC
jgi:hypothetical protein